MELDINSLNLKTARNMLVYECNLRKSDEIQNMYDIVASTSEYVEDYVQGLTLEKFNYKNNKVSLNNYRLIYAKFGSDVIDYAFYLKYNMMKKPLQVGSKVPDVLLYNYNKKLPESLFRDIQNDKPLIIFSGSIS
jgi:hypothetical protein